MARCEEQTELKLIGDVSAYKELKHISEIVLPSACD